MEFGRSGYLVYDGIARSPQLYARLRALLLAVFARSPFGKFSALDHEEQRPCALLVVCVIDSCLLAARRSFESPANFSDPNIKVTNIYVNQGPILLCNKLHAAYCRTGSRTWFRR